MQLSDEQIDIVLDQINRSGLTNVTLQDDLLDHYCCYIEAEINKGIDFDIAYHAAFLAITPNGMFEIQEEYFFLMTFKTQTNMKRIIYLTGYFSTFFISTGIMSHYFNWPFRDLESYIGYISLIICICTIFVNAIRRIKIHSRIYNFRLFIGLLAGFLIADGNLFKLRSFYTANMQIALGMFLFNFLFMPLFFFQLYKQSLSKT